MLTNHLSDPCCAKITASVYLFSVSTLFGPSLYLRLFLLLFIFFRFSLFSYHGHYSPMRFFALMNSDEATSCATELLLGDFEIINSFRRGKRIFLND